MDRLTIICLEIRRPSGVSLQHAGRSPVWFPSGNPSEWWAKRGSNPRPYGCEPGYFRFGPATGRGGAAALRPVCGACYPLCARRRCGATIRERGGIVGRCSADLAPTGRMVCASTSIDNCLLSVVTSGRKNRLWIVAGGHYDAGNSHFDRT